MSHRQYATSGSPYEASTGFSRAVKVGNRTCVAGTAPILPDGSSVPGGAADQARRCFEIIRDALAAVGTPLSDVVRTRMYLTDAADGDAVAAVHAEFFRDIRPAATMVVISGLLRPEWCVEIEAEAESHP